MKFVIVNSISFLQSFGSDNKLLKPLNMKFIVLFVAVAILAVNVAAYSTQNERAFHDQTQTVEYKSFFETELGIALKKYYGNIKYYLAEPLAYFIEKVYETYQRIEKLFPQELTYAFANFYAHFPTYSQFFPHEFVNAITEAFFAFADTYFPPEFFAQFYNYFPNFGQFFNYFPRELLQNVGSKVEHIPCIREILKNTYLVLEQLVHPENHPY